MIFHEYLKNNDNFLNLKIKETGKQEFFEWFSGFCDGESNFSIDLKKLNTLVIFRFRIGILIDDINILRKIKLELSQLANKEIGKIIEYKNYAVFDLSKFEDHRDLIIPLFFYLYFKN